MQIWWWAQLHVRLQTGTANQGCVSPYQHHHHHSSPHARLGTAPWGPRTLGDCIMTTRASLDSTRMRSSAVGPLNATLRRIDAHTAGSRSLASTRFTPGTCTDR